jgi:hypothetical protein
MRAFHNDPAIKALYLARVRAHRAADEIVHGYYWENGHGCGVGCTIHGSSHAAYEADLGIPRILARLEDSIFEALDSPDDTMWPEQFLDAIPVGAILSMVWPHFALALLSDNQYGILQYVQQPQYIQQKIAIEMVVVYYRQWISDDIKPAAAATAAVAVAAYAAAAVAAAAAYAAAAAAAVAAAAAAYAAAAVAAAAYAAAAVAVAKRQDARRWQAQTLLRLLREAPVPQLAA